MKNKIPEVILNEDGYPSEEFLNFVEKFAADEDFTIQEFLEVLKSAWWMGDSQMKITTDEEGNKLLELHTGGWSGNEEIIEVILKNMWLTHFSLYYTKWEVGGHYYFKIKT